MNTAAWWFILLPELWLSVLAFLVLVLDILSENPVRHRSIGALTAVGLLPVLGILALQAHVPAQSVFSGFYRLDPLALFFKGLFTLSAFFVILMTRESADSAQSGHGLPASHAGEFYLLILSATLGMFFAASSGNFVMLFVSLELITISFYVMTAYLKSELQSLEAGLKYLILGSMASGFLLYGIALLYGSTGSLQFSEIQTAIQHQAFMPLPLFCALVLITAGILFKTSAVPFQVWTPDVYEGAPIPVTAFLSVGSKAAGFLVALRVLHQIFYSAHAQWTVLFVYIAGLTILYGNLGALPQKNIKRLFGYSSIGHAGYLLIGVASGAGSAVSFYLLSYLFTNMAAFLVITCFSKKTGSDEMKDYAGLSQRSPFLAAAMFIALLSLAGVPPLSGFFGKFLLLLSAVSAGYFWLAMIGAAAVVISLYYYLLLVKTMYADPPSDVTPIPVSLSVKCALILCLVGIIGMGVWQAPFLRLADASVKALF